jgi:hypothetical protein
MVPRARISQVLRLLSSAASPIHDAGVPKTSTNGLQMATASEYRTDDPCQAMKNKKANPEGLAYLLESTGAAGRNRTGDLRITNAQ